MIIGIFYSADDGFAGQLFCVGLNNVPIALVPSGTGNAYALLIAGKDISTSVEIGKAKRKPGKDGGSLEVKIDGPLLPAPIKATMDLKPSREGIYTLLWNRTGA